MKTLRKSLIRQNIMHSSVLAHTHNERRKRGRRFASHAYIHTS